MKLISDRWSRLRDEVPLEYEMPMDYRTDPEHPRRLVGYAAVFNSLSLDLGGFGERIVPGAPHRPRS